MFRSESILALDIGAGSVKMGRFAPVKGGGIELVQYAVRSLEAEYTDEASRLAAITAALGDIVAEQHLGGSSVLLSVPGQAVFSRFVKLPPVSRDKVLQIVQYEAQQNVPFPINEVVWDYQLIGSGEGELDVMLAAIKAEIIEQLTDAVEAAGLTPGLVDVAPMAVYNAVRYNYAELPPCTLVIDIGARSTDLIFIEEDRVFNRSIPVGGNTITQQVMREFDLSHEDAEKLKRAHAFVALGGAYEAPSSETADKVSKSVRSVMTRLHAEINRSINFYRTQQSGEMPGLVLLTGGSSVIAHADTFLNEKLGVEVDYLNPFLNVAVNPSIDAGEIGAQAQLMGEVVGLALRRVLTCPIEINLLPAKIIREKAARRKQPFFVVSMFFFALILFVWCGYFAKLSLLGEKRLEVVGGRVRSLEAVERRLSAAESRVREVEEKTAVLNALPAESTQWLRLLDAVRQALPDGMWVTHLRPVLDGDETDGAPALDGPEGGMAYLGGPGDGGPPEAAEVKALDLTAYGYRDKVGSAGAIRLRDALRESEHFTEETDITEQPVPGNEDVTMEFTMRVVLRNPIEL